MNRTRFCLLLVLLAALSGPARAALSLAAVFGDHMVLQRDQPIRVWGQALPRQVVTVQLADRQGRAVADARGRWQLQLAALPAGGPHRLTARADSTVTLDDVLIGDLWLCSGQSNMEWTLAQSQDAPAEIAAADHPTIRYRRIAHQASLQPQAEVPAGDWQVSRPDSAGRFSAVAYHFARRLQADLKVPIGLLDTSWGGTHIETWTSRRAAQRNPDLAPVLRSMPADERAYADWMLGRQLAEVQRWQGKLPTWTGSGMPDWGAVDIDDSAWPELVVPQIWETQGLPGFDGQLWLRRVLQLDAAQAAGTATLHLNPIDDCDDTFVNGQRVGGVCAWNQPRRYDLPPGTLREGRNVIAIRVRDTGGGGGLHGDAALSRLDTAAGSLPLAGRWKARVEAPLRKTEPDGNDLPTLLFNGLVQPLLPLRLRGVIWYQGESNAGRAQRYEQALAQMIGDWRAHWGQGDLPFLYVQLAAFQPGPENPLGSEWAELRESQRRVLRLPATGMAVTIDVGDANDIHPRNKRPVGERLALLALRRVHGRQVVDSGPMWRSQRLLPQGRVELRFDTQGDALAVRGSTLQGFTVAGADRRFVPAQAQVVGDRVQVWSDSVPQPAAVRYAWSGNPAEANLVNASGLPASPFRTDRWPLLTRNVRPTF